MEEILRKLQKEASGSKYKAIKESCTWALGKRGEPGTESRDLGAGAGAGAEHLLITAGGPHGSGMERPLCASRGGGLLSLSLGEGCISRNFQSYLGGLIWDTKILARVWACVRTPLGPFILS